MVMIASGKTDRVERSQLGEIHPHIPMHTKSGWTTVSSFEEYVRFLRAQLPGPESIHLILDCYSVHRGRQIRDFAEELGITVLFIPAGMTDALQPLDRAVVGAMNATARRLYRVHGSRIAAHASRPKSSLSFSRGRGNKSVLTFSIYEYTILPHRIACLLVGCVGACLKRVPRWQGVSRRQKVPRWQGVLR
jgi:hypothetical protein